MILFTAGEGNLFHMKGHLKFSPRAIGMQKWKTNKKVYNYCVLSLMKFQLLGY